MKQFKGLLPILLVVGAILAGYFFAYPQWTKYNDAKSALTAAQQQHDKLVQAQTELNTYIAQYKSNSTLVAQADKILPRRNDVEDVLANLDTFAAASGVSLAGITFSDAGEAAPGTPKIADNNITYMEISMAATGTYASFRSFLSQFENSLRLMDILSVGLSMAEGQDNMEYKLRARVYYQK